MLKSGLVSATFRQFSLEETAAFAAAAGLHGIEWSGDTHVPPGDHSLIFRAMQAAKEHGLAVCGYASYYRLGQSAHPGSDFLKVLETARELETNTIRIWAGTKGSAAIDESERQSLYEEASLLCSLAAPFGIQISTEYHPDTLTDTLTSAQDLLQAVSGLKTHWQVPPHSLAEENLTALCALGSQISTIHVQNCEDRIYYPLSDGENNWRRYIAHLSNLPGTHYLCMEFVKDGSPEQLIEDAKALNKWISGGPNQI